MATLLAGCAAPLVAASAAPAAPPSLCAPPADKVSPVATSAAFGRSTVDLNTGSRTQTVTVNASDGSGSGAPSGVAGVSVEVSGNRFAARVKLALTSGTRASGAWTGSFAVSRYAHPGTYTFRYLFVRDGARNDQSYENDGAVADGPNSLSLHPADDPSFTVTGTPATPPKPKQAGSLASFSIGKKRVDTTSAPQFVGFVAKFAGAAPARVGVTLSSAGSSRGEKSVYLRANLHRHGGSWSGTVKVPRWLGNQQMQAGLFVEYAAGFRPRFRDFDADELELRHFDSALRVTSGVDRTDPILTSLSFSPKSINSTKGPERVTVTARASDALSGVRDIDIDSGIRHGANGVAAGSYPYATAGIGYQSSEDFHVRLTKSADGTWRGTTTVRECVPSGTYKLTASVSDYAGNTRYYRTAALAKAGITSSVEVTSRHGDVEAPYVYSAATYGADSELFLNFSEGVRNVDTSTLSVFALSPAKGRFTKSARVSSFVCANGKTVVDCSGEDGLVTSAVLTVPSMKAGVKYDVYANLDQVVPQLTDGNRNPLRSDYSAAEVKDS